MPLGEIRERFTTSEVVLMGWRSQEQAVQFKKRSGGSKGKQKGDSESYRQQKYGAGDVIPDGLPDEFFNAEGEVDLSKVTGREARKYMSLIGINLPVGMAGKPIVMKD